MTGAIGFQKDKRGVPVSFDDPLPVDTAQAGSRPEIGDSGATVMLPLSGPAVACAAGATTVLKLGSNNGARGDIVTRLIFVVTDNSTATVRLMDGDGSVHPDGTANAFGVGGVLVRAANSTVYSLDLYQESFNGPWTIICGAGVSVIAQGYYS